MAQKARREAMQRLRDAKSGKINQLDLFDDEEDDQENVYEMMTDKEYEDRRRRSQTSGFVVDDDGLGYADDGYDLEDDEEEEDDEDGTKDAADEARKRRRMLQRMNGGGSLYSFFGAATQSHTSSSASGRSRFAGATSVVPGAAGVVAAAAAGAGRSSRGNVGGQADLSAMLGELDDDAGLGLGAEGEGDEEDGVDPEDRAVATAAAAGTAAGAESAEGYPDRKRSRVDGAAETDGGAADDSGTKSSRASLRASLRAGVSKRAGAGARAAPSQLRKQREAEIAASASDKRSVEAVTAASAKQGWLGGGATAAGSAPAQDAKAAEGLPLVRASFPRPVGAKKTSQLFVQDESVLPFFLIDAYEEKADPGSVYLFGKCPNPADAAAGAAPLSAAGGGAVRPCPPLVSCCVIVRGLRRTMFVYPRSTHADTGDAVGFMDVYYEVSRRLKQSLSRDAEFKVKKVQRSYAFELEDVPRGQSDFLKLVYPATERQLETTMQGKTFRRVFGTNTTSLEHFLIKRKVKGPCWLAIRQPQAVRARKSWCVCEAAVDTPKAIEVLEGDCPALIPAHAYMRTWSPSAAAVSAAAGAKGSGSGSAAGYSGMEDGTEIEVDVEEDASPDAKATLHAPTLPSPALVVLALSIKTVVNPRTHTHELVAVSGILHRTVPITGPMPEDTKVLEPFCVVCPPAQGGKLPADLADALKETPPHVQQAVRRTPNERALLNFTLSRLAAMDPDVLLGHGLQGFALDVLLHRMQAHKLRTWSRIGRINRSRMPQTSKGADGRETFTGTLAAGRLVCDTSVIGRELMQKETSYALTPLVKSYLGEERREIEPLQVPFFFSSGKALVGLLQHSLYDSWLAFRLANRMQALPLTRQISNLAGNLWSQTLLSKRSQRVEFLLLHEFHRLKFVVPDRFGPNSSAIGKGGKDGKGGSTSKRKKPYYAGGLVLEPKKGLYDKFVLLLDFNSLYPSIIQEYNICYTTILREHEVAEQGAGAAASGAGSSGLGAAIEDDMEAIAAAAAGGGVDGEMPGGKSGRSADSVYMPPIPDTTVHPEPGVLPRMISGLVNRRRAVKKELKKAKDPVTRQQMDIYQFALKILANSMYGCLGFSNSRFFAQPIAALVTSQGREILQSTKELAEGKLGMKVIYGDTDSIMVLTNSTDIKEVRGLGSQVIRAVNKYYRQVELDIDGIYARMLLLKKKKYAALTVDGTEPGPDGYLKLKLKREIKGLDMVRRDWCVLSKRIGEQVLDMLLEAGTDTEGAVDQLHELMTTLAKDMREGTIPLEEYVITKGLNKRATEYPDPTSMPHVMVAMAMMRRGRHVSVGDHIPYVIAMDNPDAVAPAHGASSSDTAAAMEDGEHDSKTSATPSGSADGGGAVAAGGSPVPTMAGGVPVSTPPKAPSAAQRAAAIVADATKAAAGNKSTGSMAGKKKGSALRAHHPDDITESEGKLLPDIEWYLVSQILPVISRLVEPIEGVSQQSLAAALGIEHAVKTAGASGGYGGSYDQEGYVPSAVLDDETRFASADRLPVACMRCKYSCEFAGVRYSQEALEAAGKAANAPPMPAHALCGLQCPVPGCGGLVVSAQTASSAEEEFGVPAFTGVQSPGAYISGEEIDECRASVGNALALSARDAVRSHMAGWQACDEPSCGTRTRQLAIRKSGCECLRDGCRGRLWPEMPFSKLHNQLEYFESLANVDASAHRAQVAEIPFPSIHPELAGVYASALAMVRYRLQQSAYHFVNPSIFSYVGALKRGDDVEKKRQVAGLEGDMDGPVVAF